MTSAYVIMDHPKLALEPQLETRKSSGATTSSWRACGAPSPFNQSSADIVLRTSDVVDFHVWRWILAEVSPVFADMFALAPQPTLPDVETLALADGDLKASDSARSPSQKDVPVIEIAETSTVLERLLRTFYPLPNYTFASLDALKPVMGAAHKYQMDGVLLVLEEVLVTQFVKVAPLRVYTIATTYDMHAAATAAARRFLTLSSSAAGDYVDELRDISAGVYHHLLAYRRESIATLAEMSMDLEYIPDSVEWTFTSCRSCSHKDSLQYTLQGADDSRTVTFWFAGYYRRVAAALREKPCREAIEDETLCDRAFKEASRCGQCREVVHDHMRRFMAALRGEIDRRISQVSLKLT